MKVEVSLTDSHKGVLKILALFENIQYGHLKQLYTVIDESDLSIETIYDLIKRARYMISHFDPDIFGIKKSLSELKFLGLIEYPDFYSINEFSTFTITEEGKRIAEAILEKRRINLRPTFKNRTTIFIACAFGYEDIDILCKDHLIPACSNLHYNAVRIDSQEPRGIITKGLLQRLSKSKSLIADLTYAKPSVYFKVGVAHGLGIPILLTCRSDHYKKPEDLYRVHFDLEQFKISFWTLNDERDILWPDSMNLSDRLKIILKNENRNHKDD